jgi:site-specific DNA recombinase
MSARWREEQNRCLREIERHEAAEQSYMDEGVQILELARNAQRLFEQQQPREKRRLLNFVLSNCSWEEAKWLPPSVNRLIYWRKPLLFATRAATSSDSNSAKSEIWRLLECSSN